ncbi:MAG TPA: ABC transporter [Candidatus Latescibacteria bacterium]|nr:ABC transporter [Candidatus Latescibacterota bacterium]
MATDEEQRLLTLEEVPQAVLASLNGEVNPKDDILLSVSSDILPDGQYGPGWLLATASDLITIYPNGAGPEQVERISIAEIQEVEVRAHFGSGVLKVRTHDEGATVAHFSRSLLGKFSKLPDEIESLIKQTRTIGDDEKIIKRNLDGTQQKRRRCQTCGQVIPRWMGVCPACLDTRKLIFRLLSYTLPYWKLATISLILLLTATFIGLTPPLLMRILIDEVLAPVATAGSDPTFWSRFARTDLLAILVGLLLLVNVLRNGLGAFRSYIMTRLGQTITFDLRQQVYRHLHHLSLSFYNERETGRIMNSITHDVSRLQDFISDGLQEAIRNVATILIICIILFTLNPGLAALVLLPTPLLVIFTIRFGARLHRVYHRLWRKWAGISALLADTIPGVRVVKAFAQEKREVSRFECRSLALLSGEIRVARIRSVFTPIMTFLTSLGTLIIWWIGGNKVLNATLTLGDFVAFTGYMWQFYGPVESLCRLNHRFQRAATSAERVFDVLDTQSDVVDKPAAKHMPRIEGKVEFKDTTFAYEPGKVALKNLSFTVEPGEMIGLAGHSGAGKSTLINLICRFYDVEEGAVHIDGQDIRDVDLKSLRDQIGVVLQDPFLFNGTVTDNIAYGKPDASMDEIVAAAKAANAHGFIMGFQEAYDTQVGERGTRVSGGERQRLAIARAILRNPRILILDEATASVDTETESQIQQALERLVKGRTTFAIAHRLSTLRNANRLLILKKGKLAEMGTHAELIEQDGIYAKLCSMQTQMSQIRAV